jgi:hypothetical protein
VELGKPRGGSGLTAQFLVQAAYFHDYPGEEEAALAMATAVTAEIQRQCRERGVRLLCVYLPPWVRAQPALAWPQVEEALASIPLPPEALAVDERLADGWLAWVAGAGIASVDLRPAFRAEPAEPLYWTGDHHLNLAGHRAAARALLAPLEAVLDLAR